jgi:hypothetical protein
MTQRVEPAFSPGIEIGLELYRALLGQLRAARVLGSDRTSDYSNVALLHFEQKGDYLLPQRQEQMVADLTTASMRFVRNGVAMQLRLVLATPMLRMVGGYSKYLDQPRWDWAEICGDY